jgi:gamma-glutamylcysteine synthetase
MGQSFHREVPRPHPRFHRAKDVLHGATSELHLVAVVVYTMFASGHHKQALLAQPLDAQTQGRFEATATESLQAQRQVEEQDAVSFEAFVEAYYA